MQSLRASGRSRNKLCGDGWIDWPVKIRYLPVCLFVLLALLALSASFLALFLRDEVRGDLVVQSLIHLKDFSVYFWGQDRYFSFVPLLLAWNRNPGLGLYLTALLNAFAFFSVPYLVLLGQDLLRVQSSLVSVRSQSVHVLSLFVFAGLVSFVWSTEELYFFVKDASPFPLSTALGFLSVLLWFGGLRRFDGSFRCWPRARFLLGSALLSVFSLAVAPTTIGLSLTFLVFLLVNDRSATPCRGRSYLEILRVIAPYLVVAALGWLLIQCADSLLKIPRLADYSVIGSLGLVRSSINSVRVISQERLRFASFSQLRLVLGLLVVCWALFGRSKFALFRLPGLRGFKVNSVVIFWAYGFAAFLIFSSMDWVAQNGFHFRYQYPIYLAWILSAVLVIDDLMVSLREILVGTTSTRALAASLCLVLSISIVVRPALIEASSARGVLSAGRWLSVNRISFIGGDYWSVWPLYLLSMVDDSIIQFESVAHRSSSNFRSHGLIRSQVANDFAADNPVYLGCLGNITLAACSSQFLEVIQPVAQDVMVEELAPSSGQPPGLRILSFSPKS